jgi:hypothetical protein
MKSKFTAPFVHIPLVLTSGMCTKNLDVYKKFGFHKSRFLEKNTKL